MRFSSILVTTLPALLMITAVTCTREALVPPSASDVETTLSSDSQGPQVITVDSSDVIIDGPGRIDLVDPDSTKHDEPKPPVTTAPESVLEKLSEAYRDRDIDVFGQCLAEDYKYHHANSESAVLPTPAEEYWDREKEIIIHRNMFDPNFKPRNRFRSLELITVSFTLLRKEPYGDRSDNRWQLHCRAVWDLWNTQMAPKPLNIRHEGTLSLVVKLDSSDAEDWLIEIWQEDLGETRFVSRP